MSNWWILRLIWLMLGLLTGVIVMLPESAELLTGIVALIFIVATLVILGRWAILVVSEKLKSALAKPDPSKTTLARHEFFPGVALEFEAAKVGTERRPLQTRRRSSRASNSPASTSRRSSTPKKRSWGRARRR